MSSPAERALQPLVPADLAETLNRQFPIPRHYWVGFSGGLDSSVLLHLLAALRPRLQAPLSAIHIDHALQPGSGGWAAHCAAQCDGLGIPLTSLRVDAAPARGESPEAAARDARYAAIAAAIGEEAMLLTAHHRDDQAETLLLQLLRGSGVDGLAAMPLLRRWGGGWHARPLLGVRRPAIRDWAAAHRLRWVEDPSNEAIAADRNYLRHHVLPALSARWPGAVDSLARSAAHCADAAELLREQAAGDLDAALGGDRQRLRLGALCALPPARANNLLRLWLRQNGIPRPPLVRLQEALRQFCEASPDAGPRIAWSGYLLRRYRGEVWLLQDRPVLVPTERRQWNGELIDLGPGLGALRRSPGTGGIDRAQWRQGRVEVGYRHQGMRCRPAGRAGSRGFKKLAQDFAIPPWIRPLVPIILIDGQVAAVGDFCVCEPFAAAPGEPGWVVEWVRDHPSS